jgi:hypothetical protein
LERLNIRETAVPALTGVFMNSILHQARKIGDEPFTGDNGVNGEGSVPTTSVASVDSCSKRKFRVFTGVNRV